MARFLDAQDAQDAQKCPDDQMGLQDRGTGEDTLPSRLPRSILDLKPHTSSTVSRSLSPGSGNASITDMIS